MSLGVSVETGKHHVTRPQQAEEMIAALGIGAVGAVAGCIGAPVNAETPPPEDETEDVVAELDPAREVDVDWIAADPTDVAPVDWDEPRETTTSPFARRSSSRRSSPVSRSKVHDLRGQVPGPMIRVRRGDTVNLRFEVPADDNSDIHNVDFHAVYGPGGGAVDDSRAGRRRRELSFRARVPRPIHLPLRGAGDGPPRQLRGCSALSSSSPRRDCRRWTANSTSASTS